MTPLPRSFYQREPQLVAPDLLGRILVRNFNGEIISGIIVETEAYLGEKDEAAHAFKGKTKRNQSLYLDAGHAYVHRIHKYFCLDAVCQEAGIAGSVLIRALEPLEGIEQMKELRGKDNLKDLTTGPGKLSASLGIDLTLDGYDLTNPKGELMICDNENAPAAEVITSSRIGITKATEFQLRFLVKGNEFVSR